MNFGSNFYNWSSGELKYVFLALIIAFAVFLVIKRKFSALIGFGVVVMLLSVFVYSPTSITDLGVEAFRRIFG